MRCDTAKLVLFASVLVVFSALPVWGQVGVPPRPAGQEATVSGAGSATIHEKATTMQVHIELLGKGANLTEALEHLRQRREAARKSLKTLGVEEDTVSFGDPTLSNAQTANRRQMEQMIRQRMASMGRKPKGLKMPTTVTVTSILKAEWKLTGEDPEKQLLAVHTLQEKVKAADLGGAALAKELSPEEEELAEEMAEMNTYHVGDEQPEPGTPNFVFVATISEEARQAALAEAFAKARDEARRLAAAAGAELGALKQLDSGGGGLDGYYDGMDYGYDPYGNRNQIHQIIARQMRGTQENRRIYGANPGKLIFRCQVGATFEIKQ